MKKIIFNIFLTILLLVILFLTINYSPKLTFINTLSKQIEENSIIENLSDKHKLVYLTSTDESLVNENFQSVKDFIEQTDLKNYVDLI